MALLFWDSFDHYATANILEKYQYMSGALQEIGAFGRYGTNGLRVTRNTTTLSSVRGPIKGYPQTVTVGFALYIEALSGTDPGEMMRFYDSGETQFCVTVTAGGAVEARRPNFAGALLGTSAAGVIAAATWYYIEIQATIDNVAGAVEVRVTDAGVETTVINVAGVDTQGTTHAYVSAFSLGGDGVQAGTYVQRFDDLYVLDGTGAQCNDFLGDTRICCLAPEGVGTHADWTPSAGANWQCVDEIPPTDDTDYNETLTPTDRDSFEMEDLPPAAAGVVHAVCAVMDYRKDDAGTRTLQPSVRTGGADHDGDGHNSPDDYAFHTMYAWEVNPDTAAAWVAAEVNALEAGYELSA